MKGKNLIIPFIEPNEELPKELADKLMKICTESFLKRPALKDIAMTAIATFMNNVVFAGQRPDKVVKIDSSVVFCVDDSIRIMPFGASRVIVFSEGGVLYETPLKEFPRVGMSAVIDPECSEVMELGKERNGILQCSKAVTDKLTNDELREMLETSESSEEWLTKIEQALGDAEYAAQCVKLPERKKK